MNNFIESRQLYLLQIKKRREREARNKRIRERMCAVLINVLGAILGVGLCALWFWLYWYVCP